MQLGAWGRQQIQVHLKRAGGQTQRSTVFLWDIQSKANTNQTCKRNGDQAFPRYIIHNNLVEL